MKRSELLFALAGLLIVAAPAIAEDMASKTTMKLISIPIAEKLHEAAHKILPYRSGDRIFVVVIDPILCGQKPVNPQLAIHSGKITLRYDLSEAPPESVLPNCAAHSIFDLANVPHGDFQVEFSGGKEPLRTAQVTRCPNREPVTDIWDCMAPTAQSQATMTFTSLPTVGEDLGTIAHKILAYQSQDRLIVIVVDPIICGQRPINPRFEIKDHKIFLRYDLTAASTGARMGCTAHSIFDLGNVPQGDLPVKFEGGDERVRSAELARCPSTEPVMDIWGCIAPLRGKSPQKP